MSDIRLFAQPPARKRPIAWATGLMLVVSFAVSGLVVFHAAPLAQADAFTGCHGVQLSSAQTSTNGYILSAAVVAQYGNGGEFGTAYCGSMKTVATLTVPAAGKGGTLTVSLNGDTTGTVSNMYTFPDAGTSSYTFTETSPSANPRCATGSATFASTSGLTLTATTGKACPR